MKELMYTRLNSGTPVLSHRLYDDKGQLVARSDNFCGQIRGKVRIIGSDGSVINQTNMTIYPGRRFVLEAILKVNADEKHIRTLNEALGINHIAKPSDDIKARRKVCLVGIGDGAAKATEFGNVYGVRANDNNLVNIIPLRTIPDGTFLTGSDESKYYMRATGETIGGNKYTNYYLKEVFANEIVVKLKDTDHRPQETDNAPEKDPSDDLVLYNVQVNAIFDIQITQDDVKGYFQAKEGNINKAKFNEMSLFFGTKVELAPNAQGEVRQDYVAVEAFSRLSFNHRAMDSAGSSYRFLYYLIS